MIQDFNPFFKCSKSLCTSIPTTKIDDIPQYLLFLYKWTWIDYNFINDKWQHRSLFIKKKSMHNNICGRKTFFITKGSRNLTTLFETSFLLQTRNWVFLAPLSKRFLQHNFSLKSCSPYPLPLPSIYTCWWREVTRPTMVRGVREVNILNPTTPKLIMFLFLSLS